jgi:hypothetical protein
MVGVQNRKRTSFGSDVRCLVYYQFTKHACRRHRYVVLSFVHGCRGACGVVLDLSKNLMETAVALALQVPQPL